ncbi:MAG: ACT domain-containing protein [Fuerstiella sp.]
MPSLVVTLVGPDRPGLVGAVSDVVRRHGGNWRESRMSHLAGQFAGIVLVEAPDDRSEALVTDLHNLSSLGLKVVAQLDTVRGADAGLTGDADAGDGTLWTVSVVGNDRPGIVREVTQVLAAHDVNVEELTTACSDAPLAGGQIFRATIRLRVPEGLSVELLQDELEGIAMDLMIDFTAEPVGS